MNKYRIVEYHDGTFEAQRQLDNPLTAFGIGDDDALWVPIEDCRYNNIAYARVSIDKHKCATMVKKIHRVA